MSESVTYILERPVIMLASAIILSILIERLMEVIKGMFDYVSAVNYHKHKQANDHVVDFWTRLATKLARKLETRLDNAKSGDEQHFSMVMTIASRYLSANEGKDHGLFVVSAAKIRGIFLKLAFKVLAIVFGIILAWVLSLDIISLVKLNLKQITDYAPSVFGYLVTGVSIGLGSGPLHKIIIAMEDSRKKRDVKE